MHETSKQIIVDDLHLTHGQLEELFDYYERERELKFLVKDQKKRFIGQFKNRDVKIA